MMEKEPNTRDYSPFVGLKKSEEIIGGSADFYELPGHPEIVIRKCYTPEVFGKRIKEEIMEQVGTLNYKEEELEKLVKHKRVDQLIKNASEFSKIFERYHLRFAESRYVIGKDPVSGKDEIFAVTDRIEGQSLEEIYPMEEKIADEIDEMYEGMFLSLKESYLENGVCMEDFRSSQMIYGTKQGENEPHVYFIDADPLVFYWKEEMKEGSEDEKEPPFWNEVLFLFEDMTSFETKLLSKKFVKARAVLESIIKEFPEPKDSWVQKDRAILIKEMGVISR